MKTCQIVLSLLLLCFLMERFFLAELAVLVELDAVWVVSLVLCGVVVPLLAFCAGEHDSYSGTG